MADEHKSPKSRESYLIGGHGSEDTRYSPIILPKDVYVVVKARAGESSMVEDNLDMKLCDLPDKVLQNPEKYPDMIYDAIGSFFLYKPGDECPNFKFSTVNAYMDSDIPNVKPKLSGIMNISSVKKKHYKDKKLIRYVYPQNELEFVENMFTSDEYSFKHNRIQKNGKWITEFIPADITKECAYNNFELRDEIVSKEELIETIDNIINLDVYNTKMYDIIYNFGESELLTHGAVFYHLVCRYRKDVSEKLYGTPTSFNNVATREPIIINRVPSRKNDPDLYRLIQNTISNAERMKSYTRNIMTRKKQPITISKQKSLNAITKSIVYKKPENTRKYITNIAIKIIMNMQQNVLKRTDDTNLAELVVYLTHNGITTGGIVLLFQKLDELLSYYKDNTLFKRMQSFLINKSCQIFVALLYNKWSIAQVNALINIMTDETRYKKDPDSEEKIFRYIEDHYLYHSRL